MSETWAYNPDAGRWTQDRPPTRAEALKLAADCASASADNTISPEAGIARAHSAQAWAAVAAVAPGEMPIELDPPQGVLRTGEDHHSIAAVQVGTCRHECASMRILPDGDWLHVPSLRECADPPTAVQVVSL